MKKLVCECCGGKINRSTKTCEYCGTQYIFDDDSVKPIVFEIVQKPCERLGGRIKIPMESLMYMGEEKASEYAIRELTRKLAEGLRPFMRIETEYDPIEMKQIITADVRVVYPDYRF